MASVVIQVVELSKRYRLGTIGTGTLSRDLNQWWAKFRGKEDPYSVIEGATHFREGDFWALQDVNFEVKQGEAIGIIGKNGAGKSTLLKILSRVTIPTAGEIRIKGRIASLLEVGTGFHPELTGRQNIFLNGAILGMTKREIKTKLDEIITFSGVEKHIDTPVKRYSSGMYVRLAFAVAAHLEPEILILDEVLAVGDAEFQKKCLGKMNEVVGQGRTVLFVSHNMQAVNNLCPRAIWLQNGRICANGDSKTVVNRYLTVFQKKTWYQYWDSLEKAPGNNNIKIVSVELIPQLLSPLSPIDTRTPITVRFRFNNFCPDIVLTADLLLFTAIGECIFDIPTNPAVYAEGIIEGECTIPGNFLNNGSYYFSIYFGKDTSQELFYFENCLYFEIEDYRENISWYDKWWGYVRPKFPFALKNIPAGISAHPDS
jgi:lipopolysaccharide transport system ATP-binding protein